MSSVTMACLFLLLFIANIADFLAVENSTLNELRLRRDRRTAYADDSQDCYKAFFVGRTPPTGLGRSCGKYKYICQKLSDDITYFATMFDEGVGIPVYSAYLVEKANALNFKTEDRHLLDETWRQEDGVKLQASDEMYEKQKMYDKGHLLPVGIYSFDKNYAQSTFTYTNAVPQIRLFNRGAWKKYEGEIREFAETCGRRGGNLYAITGAAQLAQYNGAVMPLKQLKSKICVPQAMWTASCCVTSSGVENYAVVGNNRGSASDITMTEVTVEKLQEFIHKDIKAHGDNPATSVRLFPGKPECENRKNSKRKAEPDDAEPSSPKKVKTKKPQSQNTIY